MNIETEPDRPLTRWDRALIRSLYVLVAVQVVMTVLLVLWGVWLIGDYAWREVW